MPRRPKTVIERMSISALRPASYNPREISDEAMSGLEASVERFGLVQPIVWNRRTKTVVGGHQRLRVCESLGQTEVDVVVVSLPVAEEKALNVALNNPHIAGSFTEALDALLDEIRESVPDLYDDLLLADLAGPTEPSDGRTDADDVPPVPRKAKTKLGDVLVLGDHRVVCGDSADPVALASLYGTNTIDAVVTDPPYGVEYVGKTDEALTIENDGAEGLEDFLRASLAPVLERTKPGGVWYVAGPTGPQMYDFLTVLRDWDVWRQTLIWSKDVMVMGRSDYHYQHEVLLYGWAPGAAHQRPPDRKQTSVWEIERPKASREHPTMKPVALFERAIRNSTMPQDVVADPFLGSGTTLLACERLGRRCYGMELSPAYCDVIATRWEDFTGRTAERQRAPAAASA